MAEIIDPFTDFKKKESSGRIFYEAQPAGFREAQANEFFNDKGVYIAGKRFVVRENESGHYVAAKTPPTIDWPTFNVIQSRAFVFDPELYEKETGKKPPVNKTKQS